jgi:catechol 2,3-dioxygenase-like lactoylglutathione lyase family enzyme
MAELPTLQNITVIVTDLAAAKDFYAGKLGLRVLTEFPGDYCSIELGSGVQLGLHIVHPEHDHAVEIRGIYLSLQVDDINLWHKRLTEAGVEFSRPPTQTPWGTVEAYVADPDGHIITLKSRSES